MGEYKNKIETSTGLDLMKNKTFSKVFATDHEMIFETEDGEQFEFSHIQDCCEDVHIEDIVGDLDDLVGTPLLQADEVTDNIYTGDEPVDVYEYTFYNFATIKGYVTVRWLGDSNGYYSTSVDMFYRSKQDA